MIQERAKEAYTWRVVCTDGSYIGEYDRKEGRGFAEVSDMQIRTLDLIPCIPFDDVIHRVLIPDGATPVFFRRRSVDVNPLGGEVQPRPTVHCIGWKQGEVAVYLFISSDGNTLLTDDLQAV